MSSETKAEGKKLFRFFLLGLYLTLSVTVTFFSEQHVVKILYAIGWVLPFVLVVIYTVLRAVMGDSYKELE